MIFEMQEHIIAHSHVSPLTEDLKNKLQPDYLITPCTWSPQKRAYRWQVEDILMHSEHPFPESRDSCEFKRTSFLWNNLLYKYAAALPFTEGAVFINMQWRCSCFICDADRTADRVKTDASHTLCVHCLFVCLYLLIFTRCVWLYKSRILWRCPLRVALKGHLFIRVLQSRH